MITASSVIISESAGSGAGGGGTVTSVSFVGDGTVLSTTPSGPITTSGTLTAALLPQTANTVLAGPASGIAANPTFRALVKADLPSLAASDLSNGVTGSGAVALAGSPTLTGTPAAPTASVGTNTTQIATTAFVLANSSSSAGLGNFNVVKLQRQLLATANGSNATVQDWGGITSIVTGGGGSGGNAASATTPPNIGIGGVTTNTVASFSSNACYAYGYNVQAAILMNITRTTNNTGTTNRFWVGISDQTAATMAASDTPVGNFAAFRFSNGVTSAGDVNWQCITNNNDSSGASPTVVNSGVAPVTAFTLFSIVANDSVPNVQFYINGTLVATIATTTPTPGKLMLWFVSSDQTSVAVGSGLSWAQTYMTSAQF